MINFKQQNSKKTTRKTTRQSVKKYDVLLSEAPVGMKKIVPPPISTQTRKSQQKKLYLVQNKGLENLDKEENKKTKKRDILIGVSFVFFGQVMFYLYAYLEKKFLSTDTASHLQRYLTEVALFLGWFSTWTGLDHLMEGRHKFLGVSKKLLFWKKSSTKM